MTLETTTVRPDDVRVTVQWASSAFDYMPFTPLPARYHGKVVALVIVEEVIDEPFSLA